jgi:type II secretory pathway pseudopilin PulG
MLKPAHMTTHGSDEQGFSLVELLVAMSSGIVVCLALFAMLSFATHQQAKLTDAVQADQLSRGTMTKIVDALHSSCISPEFTPIQEKSTETDLRFVNAYSSAAVISEPEALLHEIEWNKATGTLTEKVSYDTAGTWPSFTAWSSPKTIVLAKNVAQVTRGGKAVPIFQYYGYTLTASSGAEETVSTLGSEPLKDSPELVKANAAKAAAVAINFKLNDGASSKEEEHAGGRVVELSDEVTLAFSAPKSASTVVDGPCQ